VGSTISAGIASDIGKRMKKLRSATSGKHLRRVRRICAALPETTEKLSHGEPTFLVRKKVFAGLPTTENISCF